MLTAEISGIAPALTTAYHLGLPVVYARKSKPITMPDQVFLTLTPSHTKGRTVELIVSPEFLAGGERILIIDDFLASGATILGLVRLAQTAGAIIVGIGALIEKSFEGGRDALAELGVPVEALAVVSKMDGDNIWLENPEGHRVKGWIALTDGIEPHHLAVAAVAGHWGNFMPIAKDKGTFFNDLVAYMTSGPVMIQVLQGEDAVAKNREIMGATNPAEADAGTIRADFAASIEENVVHGSDAADTAAAEIGFFFGEEGVCPRTR